MQRPGAGASNLSSSSAASDAEDDARAETVALLDDLKERLGNTETLSEQFQKQAQVLQSRLDEALQEQGKLEDRLHENEERLETLENDKRDALRQKREMEAIYEAERSSMTKEREEMSNREEEMQTIIQRLKDSLSQRSNVDEESRLSRRCKFGLFLIETRVLIFSSEQLFTKRRWSICTSSRLEPQRFPKQFEVTPTEG
jgi:chromosome segregation ATPase